MDGQLPVIAWQKKRVLATLFINLYSALNMEKLDWYAVEIEGGGLLKWELPRILKLRFRRQTSENVEFQWGKTLILRCLNKSTTRWSRKKDDVVEDEITITEPKKKQFENKKETLNFFGLDGPHVKIKKCFATNALCCWFVFQRLLRKLSVDKKRTTICFHSLSK